MAKYYTTVSGDTWDTVSYKNYGGEIYTADLLFNNQQYKNIAVFPAGIVLFIPYIEVTILTSVAPWLRETQSSNTVDAVTELPVFDPSYNNLISYRWVDKWADVMYKLTRWGDK